MSKKVIIEGYEFEKELDSYVRFQKETDIMLSPIDPKDKHTKWEGWLHEKDGTVIQHIESYSPRACVVIAASRHWFNEEITKDYE